MLKDYELFNQIRNVLKLKIGEKIILGDGKMNEGIAEIKEYGKDFIRVEAGEIKINQNEPAGQVILYCAILKKENFELVIQKATEIGVKEIVPLITARTVKLDIKKDRLEKIIKEASEQSGRGIMPILHDPLEFNKTFDYAKHSKVNLFFDSSGGDFTEDFKLKTENYLIGVWIGPEGGWDSQELELARKSGFKIINLGKLTLRAETAAIVATYRVVHNSDCH